MRRTIKMAAISVVALLCGILSATLSGQSKKETKQYQKAVKLGTIEGYRSFLTKFPESVYVPKVEHFIDSINYSGVNLDEISSCVAFMYEYPSSEYFTSLEERVKSMALDQRYIQDNNLSLYRVVHDFEVVEFSGNSFYYYIYENLDPGFKGELLPGMKCEYVVNMLDKKSGAIHSSMFSGKVIPANNDHGYMLEGDFMDEGAAGGYVVPEAIYLLNILKETDFLLPISEGDVMTDQAIEWWQKNNPATAKRLKFGLLPQESSIVEMFANQKDTESNSGYKVAQFDIRGYTVIVAYQKSSGEYMLVWSEPVCKDKKSDPLLNTIYFENANSLVLYYYKGRTTYKVRINMANKTIAR
mgnify:FL=1